MIFFPDALSMLSSVFGFRGEIVSKSSAFGRDSVQSYFIGYGVSTGVTERSTGRVLPGLLRTIDSNSRPLYSYRTR